MCIHVPVHRELPCMQHCCHLVVTMGNNRPLVLLPSPNKLEQDYLSFSYLGRQGFHEVLALVELEPGLVVGLCFIPIAGIQSTVTIFARGIGGREEGLVLPPKSPAVVLGAGKKRQTELRNQSSSAPSHAAVN